MRRHSDLAAAIAALSAVVVVALAGIVVNLAAVWTLSGANRRSRVRYQAAQSYGIDHVTLQPDWRTPVPGKRVIPVMPVSTDNNPHLH